MASNEQEPRYYVRRDRSGACYVIDGWTATCVYGTFRAQDAQNRCDELKFAADPAGIASIAAETR